MSDSGLEFHSIDFVLMIQKGLNYAQRYYS